MFTDIKKRSKNIITHTDQLENVYTILEESDKETIKGSTKEQVQQNHPNEYLKKNLLLSKSQYNDLLEKYEEMVVYYNSLHQDNKITPYETDKLSYGEIQHIIKNMTKDEVHEEYNYTSKAAFGHDDVMRNSVRYANAITFYNLAHPSDTLSGGSPYYSKYLKYKNKYLELKKINNKI